MNTPELVADKLLGIDLKRYEARVLCVSIAMIPLGTNQALEDPQSPLCMWVSSQPHYDTGWLIYAWDPPEELKVIAPELFHLLRFAESRGFDYLRLDADSIELPETCGFPTFSW